jgi:hypothetical protein
MLTEIQSKEITDVCYVQSTYALGLAAVRRLQAMNIALRHDDRPLVPRFHVRSGCSDQARVAPPSDAYTAGVLC